MTNLAPLISTPKSPVFPAYNPLPAPNSHKFRPHSSIFFIYRFFATSFIVIMSLSRDSATKTVQAIMKGERSDCDLVSFQTFKSQTKLRSTRYESFYVLCHKNTHKSTGWLICRYVTSKGCKLASGLLSFHSTNGGTGRLERHAKLHETLQTSRLFLPRPLPSFSKSKIARAAALAVAFDLRPISFTEKKRGIKHFAAAIFRAGQEMPVSEHVDQDTILPSATCVNKALRTVAHETREEYRELILEKMYEPGGGVSTDGVTLTVQDKQFQDLTVHFLEVTGSGSIDVEPKSEMKVATLLLKEKPEAGDAATIREMLSTYLFSHYGKGIDWLTKRFTMVTDCASVMARVALSSVSPNVAPMDEKWMGCLVHQLNTAMKCCIGALCENENRELQNISQDLQSVKKIVRIFKQSNWNGCLPNGYHLIQECETRFSTTLTVSQRFLKSANLVKGIVEKKNSSPAKGAFAQILKEGNGTDHFRMPALEAIVDAFQVLVDAQTKIQAANVVRTHTHQPTREGDVCTVADLERASTCIRRRARRS